MAAQGTHVPGCHLNVALPIPSKLPAKVVQKAAYASETPEPTANPPGSPDRLESPASGHSSETIHARSLAPS